MMMDGVFEISVKQYGNIVEVLNVDVRKIYEM